MEIITASDARKRLYQLVDQAGMGHNPVYIKGRRGTAVLVSEEEWRGMVETLYLESIPGMKESILNGMKEPLSESTPLEELDW